MRVEQLTAYIASLSAHPEYVSRFSEELRHSGNRVPLTADLALWDQAVQLGETVLWLQTFGQRGKAPEGASSIFETFTGVALPSYEKAVGSAMPERAVYEPLSRTLSLGAGLWSEVDPRVWEYTVGGNRVLESWVGYRRAKPKGKKTSPLNDLVTTNWPSEWSKELHEILVVLTHLVQLEDKQADLLDSVLTSPLLDLSTLQELGVQWPSTAKDRKPRMPGEKLF